MPRHKQVTTCRKSGGPVSKFCTCEHCTLAVCSVCGAYEGGLTTDCPGQKVDFDRQQEVYQTDLDYTDERGWHLGEPMARRTPRFTSTPLPPTSPRDDPRTVVAPRIDWTKVDHAAALQHELTQRAIEWVLADRACDDRSASLVRAEGAVDDLREKQGLDEHATELLAKLEREKIEFQLACRSAERCDEEFKQAARRLTATLESAPQGGEPGLLAVGGTTENNAAS